MSMTKRAMDAERDARLAKEKAECGCYFDMDDKFEVLCPKHQEEAAALAEFEYQEHEEFYGLG